MDMILPIVCGLLILLGLVAVVMSRTNWPVYQIILVVFVLLANAAFLYLAARALYTHREWRSEVARYERAYAQQFDQYKTLTGELDGRGEVVVDRDDKKSREIGWTVDDWKAEAAEVLYGRGRVLSGLTPKVDRATGVITVAPGSASFPKQSTVFVFEMDSIRNRQPGRFLGQYIVSNADDQSLALTPVNPEQMTDARGLLAIYEVAPVDSHDAFAHLSIDELRSLFPPPVPPEVVQQYLKDGKAADPQNDPPDRVWRRVQFKKEHKAPLGDAQPVAAAAAAEPQAAADAARPENGDAAADEAVAPAERIFAAGDQAIMDPQTAKDLVDRDIAEYVESKPEEGIYSHVYVRPLNDYPSALRDIRSQLLSANVQIAELDRQLQAIDKSIKLAQQSEQVRKEEATRLADDLNKFTAEAGLIEKHHEALVASVNAAQSQIAAYKRAIASQAGEFARLQLRAAESIKARGPSADAAAAR